MSNDDPNLWLKLTPESTLQGNKTRFIEPLQQPLTDIKFDGLLSGWKENDNTMRTKDIKVFPVDTRYEDFTYIVYDPKHHEYYNKASDIFLCDDDISFYKLRPYALIDNPLPSPLPPDYFINWNEDESKNQNT